MTQFANPVKLPGAMGLKQIALRDDYIIEKKLYPNVDFYSSITLKLMGYPTSMFTVLSARAAGSPSGAR